MPSLMQLLEDEVDLNETVQSIDNLRLVVVEGRRTNAGSMARELDQRSSVSSRGSSTAAKV